MTVSDIADVNLILEEPERAGEGRAGSVRRVDVARGYSSKRLNLSPELRMIPRSRSFKQTPSRRGAAESDPEMATKTCC